MKIIAITPTRYLVEMECAELGALAGVAWPGGHAPLADLVGKTYNITGAWNTIRRLQQHQDALPQLSERLTSLAALLNPIITELPIER